MGLPRHRADRACFERGYGTGSHLPSGALRGPESGPGQPSAQAARRGQNSGAGAGAPAGSLVGATERLTHPLAPGFSDSLSGGPAECLDTVPILFEKSMACRIGLGCLPIWISQFRAVLARFPVCGRPWRRTISRSGVVASCVGGMASPRIRSGRTSRAFTGPQPGSNSGDRYVDKRSAWDGLERARGRALACLQEDPGWLDARSCVGALRAPPRLSMLVPARGVSSAYASPPGRKA